MVEIVNVDWSNPAHGRAVVDLLNLYACDPIGGGEALPDHVRAGLVPALRDRAGIHALLAFVDDAAAGLVICMEGFSTFAGKPLLNIHDLVVTPAQRGQGIATRLLQACEQLARTTGCCKLTLEVLEGNTAARSVYARFGFAPYQLDPELGRAMFWEKKL
jgi:GNAT superfamily N-acetyltransferase